MNAADFAFATIFLALFLHLSSVGKFSPTKPKFEGGAPKFVLVQGTFTTIRRNANTYIRVTHRCFVHALTDGATQCLTYKHRYSSTSECAKQRASFEVKRCAESSDALKTYVEVNFACMHCRKKRPCKEMLSALLEDRLQGLDLDNRLTPDVCKQMWLRGCSNFYQSDKYVVVPKSIACNSFICDQSSFYSNCVTNADCDGVHDVKQGLPASDAVWPFANQTVLPAYRPCCSFFEKNCNGASCLGRDDSTCPLTFAQRAGFCERENCWVPGPSAATTRQPGLALALILALGTVARHLIFFP